MAGSGTRGVEVKVPPRNGVVRETSGDTAFLQDLLAALQAVRSGNFSGRLAGPDNGLESKIVDVLNDISEINQRIADQLEQVGQVVGREGKVSRRVKFGVTGGSWGRMENSVNLLIDDLVSPTTEVTR